MPQSAVDDLITLLDLEPIEVNIFRGVSPPVKQQRVFGGQVAGQALVAAARTVDRNDSSVHSRHAWIASRAFSTGKNSAPPSSSSTG